MIVAATVSAAATTVTPQIAVKVAALPHVVMQLVVTHPVATGLMAIVARNLSLHVVTDPSRLVATSPHSRLAVTSPLAIASVVSHHAVTSLLMHLAVIVHRPRAATILSPAHVVVRAVRLNIAVIVRPLTVQRLQASLLLAPVVSLHLALLRLLARPSHLAVMVRHARVARLAQVRHAPQRVRVAALILMAVAVNL